MNVINYDPFEKMGPVEEVLHSDFNLDDSQDYDWKGVNEFPED